MDNLYLVDGDWNMIGLFFHISGMSSSQLTFIFFRGVGIPPTSYSSFGIIMVNQIVSVFSLDYHLYYGEWLYNGIIHIYTFWYRSDSL